MEASQKGSSPLMCRRTPRQMLQAIEHANNVVETTDWDQLEQEDYDTAIAKLFNQTQVFEAMLIDMFGVDSFNIRQTLKYAEERA